MFCSTASLLEQGHRCICLKWCSHLFLCLTCLGDTLYRFVNQAPCREKPSLHWLYEVNIGNGSPFLVLYAPTIWGHVTLMLLSSYLLFFHIRQPLLQIASFHFLQKSLLGCLQAFQQHQWMPSSKELRRYQAMHLRALSWLSYGFWLKHAHQFTAIKILGWVLVWRYPIIPMTDQ